MEFSAKEALNMGEEWHRRIDQEVITWLDENKTATVEQFVGKMNEIYSRKEIVQKFGTVKFKEG